MERVVRRDEFRRTEPGSLTQSELIVERASLNVFDCRPGITGLAQIKGIDMSKPKLLAMTDAEMLNTLNLYSYLRFILLSIAGKGAIDHPQS